MVSENPSWLIWGSQEPSQELIQKHEEEAIALDCLKIGSSLDARAAFTSKPKRNFYATLFEMSQDNAETKRRIFHEGEYLKEKKYRLMFSGTNTLSTLNNTN